MKGKSVFPPWVYARWAAFGFLGGVFLHAPFPLVPVSFWIPAGLAVIAAVIRRRLIAIALVACALGFLRFDLTIPRESDVLAERLGATVEAIGLVKKVGVYDAALEIRTLDGIPASSASLLAFPLSGKRVGTGERWKVSCRVEKNEKPDPRFQLWDARRGIFFRCKGATSLSLVERTRWYDVSPVLSAWRLAISKRISRLLPGDPGALLSGILYGERSLAKETSDAFRFAGMTHLIAVSGSNIALVVSFFVPFLLFLGYRRQSAIILSGAGIVLFALFVGAEASVIRAALMGWLAILARVFGRKAGAAHLLLVAGTLMAVMDPWAPAFDAGFALSFLATWGLIAWSRPLALVFRRIPIALGLRETVSTTVAATVVTAPYSLWAFGSVSVAGLLTNLIAIPLTALAMLWGAVAVVFGGIVPAIAYPAQGCLQAMLLIAETSRRFPFLLVSFDLPVAGLILAYALMVWLWRRLALKKSVYPQKTEAESSISSFLHQGVAE